MALIVEDRVLEQSTTTGTGALTLSGAYTGYRTFASVCSTSDTCYYLVEAVDGSGVPSGEWETGLGTYSGANTLTRTTVDRSSNSNAAVSFAAGTKRVSLVTNRAFLRSQILPLPLTFNFTAAGDAYVYADQAMTLTQQATVGTGTITYQKSTAAAPSTFSSTSSPVTLEAGAWLKVTASSVTGGVAVHLKRTA